MHGTLSVSHTSLTQNQADLLLMVNFQWQIVSEACTSIEDGSLTAYKSQHPSYF